MENNWVCRWSPTLGALEDTAINTWGTYGYIPERDSEKPCVFFGLYGLPDFYALWRHRGKKAILWAGTDLTHFMNGYWLEEGGEIRLNPWPLAQWMKKNCEHYVENEVEARELRAYGIDPKIVPSFLGDVNKFPVSYRWSEKPKVYVSVSGDNFEQYGWIKVEKMAAEHPDIEFHLYGNTKPWPTPFSNVIVHGRVPKEQMNAEIKEMQGALRLLDHDGFSEVLAKSVLMGQWPISTIPYPHILKPDQIGALKNKKEPNLAGREYYLKNLNQYPWVCTP